MNEKKNTNFNHRYNVYTKTFEFHPYIVNYQTGIKSPIPLSREEIEMIITKHIKNGAIFYYQKEISETDEGAAEEFQSLIEVEIDETESDTELMKNGQIIEVTNPAIYKKNYRSYELLSILFTNFEIINVKTI